MKMVTGDGVRLATEAQGSPVRGDIVLVMGATASMLWWPDRLIDALVAAGYRVIRYDHRDTGQSTTGIPGDASYGLKELCDDLIAVLDDYAVESAHLVGMSLGGLIAQLAAVEHRGRVCSLTLIASEPLGGGETDLPGIDGRFLAHFGRMAELDWSDRAAVGDFMQEIARLCTGGERNFDARGVRRRIDREIDRAANIQSAFNHAAMRADLDAGWDLRLIERPTLVIHGSDDPVLPPANGRAIARQVRGAALFILQGAGHELNSTDLPSICERIIAFVQHA